MWTCPKCGRAFKKQNQDHYCGKAPETIDAYIEAQQYRFCRVSFSAFANRWVLV